MNIELKACGTTHDGKGVCRHNGKAVFVSGLIVGESALCEITSQGKKFDTAKVVSIIEKSPCRIAPDCSSYPDCGGCNYRHMTYEKELELKALRVRDAFTKLAKFDPGEITVHPSENFLRNKATFQFKGCEFGFFSQKSHSLVSVEGCKIIHPVMLRIANTFSKFLKANNVSYVKTLSVRINRDETEISLLIEANGPVFNTDFLANEFEQITAINFNGENIYGKGYISDTLCENTLNISPLSFYQISPIQAEKAYSLAAQNSGIRNTDVALDLCCGIGSITLYLARLCRKVYGAEIVPEAIENAKENAKQNGITNAHFVCNDAAKALKTYKAQGVCPNVIFVDPPRAGLDMACKEAIAEFAPEKIAYISCDCATQARDAAFFFERGYRLSSLEAVDFFPRTAHIESVACFVRCK